MKTNLQFFGGRGASGIQSDTRRISVYKARSIWDTYHSNYNKAKSQESAELMVKMMADLQKDYGILNDAVSIFQYAQIGGKNTGILGFYSGDDKTINLNNAFLDVAYTNELISQRKRGFHPPRSKKTGQEAIMSHEVGHALHYAIARANNVGVDDYAEAVVKLASRNIGIKAKGVETARGKISGYAKYNYKETIAEAVSDVYCNGNKANRLSKAITRVLKRDIKNGLNEKRAKKLRYDITKGI